MAHNTQSGHLPPALVCFVRNRCFLRVWTTNLCTTAAPHHGHKAYAGASRPFSRKLTAAAPPMYSPQSGIASRACVKGSVDGVSTAAATVEPTTTHFHTLNICCDVTIRNCPSNSCTTGTCTRRGTDLQSPVTVHLQLWACRAQVCPGWLHNCNSADVALTHACWPPDAGLANEAARTMARGSSSAPGRRARWRASARAQTQSTGRSTRTTPPRRRRTQQRT
jgi:hypothetical protein